VKKIIGCLLLVMFLAGSFMGCAMVVAPVTGGLYTDLKAPVTATSNTGSSKVGTGECTSILGMLALGDCSIDAAMKNGNITKIHHVDHDAMSFFWIYAKYTTRVYGE
jgi:hypothetical protein